MAFEPYNPPHAKVADVHDDSSTSWWSWILPIVAILLSVSLSLAGLFVVPQFEKVFTSFGSELSEATVFAFRIAKWLWLTVVIALFLLFTWRKSLLKRGSNKTKFTVAFALLCVIDIALFHYFVWAMYSPIFPIGITK